MDKVELRRSETSRHEGQSAIFGALSHSKRFTSPALNSSRSARIISYRLRKFWRGPPRRAKKDVLIAHTNGAAVLIPERILDVSDQNFPGHHHGWRAPGGAHILPSERR